MKIRWNDLSQTKQAVLLQVAHDKDTLRSRLVNADNIQSPSGGMVGAWTVTTDHDGVLVVQVSHADVAAARFLAEQKDSRGVAQIKMMAAILRTASIKGNDLSSAEIVACADALDSLASYVATLEGSRDV